MTPRTGLVGLSLAAQRAHRVDDFRPRSPRTASSLERRPRHESGSRWARSRKSAGNATATGSSPVPRSSGPRCCVQSGNSETARQLQDIESLLSRGVDVLVVVAHDPTAMGRAVASAHAAGVPVICYDRLITGCDVDLYLSFDNVRVGRLQAEYLVRPAWGQGADRPGLRAQDRPDRPAVQAGAGRGAGGTDRPR